MKKITLFLMLFIPSVSAFAQQQYTINGTVPDEHNGSYVYFATVDVYKPVTAKTVYSDSSYVENGRFFFKGDLPADTSLCMIVLNNNSGLFVLDGKPLYATYVESNPSGYFHVSGSALNNDFSRIIEFPYKKAAEMTTSAKKRTDLLAKNEWTLEDEDAAKENEKKAAVDYIESMNRFVKNNITNPAGQYLYVFYGMSLKKEIKDEIESTLSEDTKQRIATGRQEIAKMMETLQASFSKESKIKPGDKYIDFEGELISGEKTKLSEATSGKKLILLDFWASWCVPCLKEMPEIIDLHNKHKEQGLQIIGISLDKNRDKWKGAVDSFGMPWIQFIDSDLSNPISDIYGANAIPYTVLIDEHGEIVAVGLRGGALGKKIGELLSE